MVNPRASKVRDAPTMAALTEHLGRVLQARDGAEPELIETAAETDVAPAVERAVETGMAAVIAVGGDGTLRQAAASLAGTDVPLGIVPAGTGNQVAAVMGVPGSLAKAIDALESATPRVIDLGEVTIGRADGSTEVSTFLLGCGAGFDAELMATTSTALKRRIGTAAYFVQGAGLALRLSARPCRIIIDDRAVETGVTSALIGNMGQLVPGRLGLRLPLDPADGSLDLIVVSADNVAGGLAGLIEQLRRTELGGNGGDRSLRLRGTAISIEPLEPMPLEVDGDPVGDGSLHARIRPGALRVLAP
ncbi:MAG: diacylglycerol kinase family protein [Candidatus Limnocylindrales bacterium]